MLGATQRPDGWWSVYFEFEHNGMTFRDAITLSPIEYVKLTESEINEIKQIRFNRWVESLTPVETAPVVEESLEPQIIDVTPVVDTALIDFLNNKV